MLDVLAKLNNTDYKINPESKRKLLAVLATVRFPNVKESAFEMLFDLDNEKNDINPYTLKRMILSLIVLLTNPKVSEHVDKNDLKEFPGMLRELFTFFDCLDNDDYNKIESVDRILEYGEELPDAEHPHRSRNADWVYEVYIDKPSKYIMSV